MFLYPAGQLRLRPPATRHVLEETGGRPQLPGPAPAKRKSLKRVLRIARPPSEKPGSESTEGNPVALFPGRVAELRWGASDLPVREAPEKLEPPQETRPCRRAVAAMSRGRDDLMVDPIDANSNLRKPTRGHRSFSGGNDAVYAGCEIIDSFPLLTDTCSESPSLIWPPINCRATCVSSSRCRNRLSGRAPNCGS